MATGLGHGTKSLKNTGLHRTNAQGSHKLKQRQSKKEL